MASVVNAPDAISAYYGVLDPAHFEAAFKSKPRGRIMLYRDWLCGLSPAARSYLQELCHKRRAEMSQQILVLYATAQEIGREEFLTALELAAEQQMYGAEYLQAILGRPRAAAPYVSAPPTNQRPWRSMSTTSPTARVCWRNRGPGDERVVRAETGCPAPGAHPADLPQLD